MNDLDTDVLDYPDDVDEAYPDWEADTTRGIYDQAGSVDNRWRLVAAIAGAVFVLAVIASVVIVNGGDSASTSATVAPPARTVTATPRAPAPTVSLPPETVTTVTPTPRAPSPTPTAGPTSVPSAVPPPPPPQADPHTYVYQVTGTKQLFDLVTVIYTDAQGMPRTEVNVSLPWSKTVVLEPNVQLKSVVGTSLLGRLNCSITDAAGQTVAGSATNSIITTCIH
ncbi:hypothetical protein [Mycobacterium sp.]|uniref:hypothetical protein n=1 Tax=Mycobacterium sp. TaxID=1785 RepID=UPI0031DA73D0